MIIDGDEFSACPYETQELIKIPAAIPQVAKEKLTTLNNILIITIVILVLVLVLK